MKATDDHVFTGWRNGPSGRTASQKQLGTQVAGDSPSQSDESIEREPTVSADAIIPKIK